ncbi:MAG: adenylosuccinate lyase [Bacteroidetes bacterium]|nr:adenylosuccinate lyase [Bacteroidota bacterium]
MNMNTLSAISPVDGRYTRQTAPLSPYFSEFGLIKYRIRVEIEYFLALCKLPLPQLKDVDPKIAQELRKIYSEFSMVDAQAVKEIEKTTNHDVKAVEYFIKDKLDTLGLAQYREFIHFGLTSQDINNTAIPLSLKESLENVIVPLQLKLTDKISEIASDWEDIPMLARTHGQPASPTMLGKEMDVFASRLTNQNVTLKIIPITAKFGGATGNFNAHFAAYPDYDWHDFAEDFLENTFGLSRSYPTTQIDHYDNFAAISDNLKRFNTILIDFARDMWQYISMNYFNQKIAKNEVGSSAMPHKINPIDFENAEGNLGMANAILTHFSSKLPISRLQRDLSDSTVLRNIGVPLSHMIIALNSLLKGIGKLQLNEEAINRDLDENWVVIAEGIQNILRREGHPNPYETLKEFTRTGEKITKKTIKEFINNLDIDEDIKVELRELSPFNYTGF